MGLYGRKREKETISQIVHNSEWYFFFKLYAIFFFILHTNGSIQVLDAHEELKNRMCDWFLLPLSLWSFFLGHLSIVSFDCRSAIRGKKKRRLRKKKNQLFCWLNTARFEALIHRNPIFFSLFFFPYSKSYIFLRHVTALTFFLWFSLLFNVYTNACIYIILYYIVFIYI